MHGHRQMSAVLNYLFKQGWHCPPPIATNTMGGTQQYIVVTTKDSSTWDKLFERMSAADAQPEWKEFWGSEPTMDGAFNAHVFEIFDEQHVPGCEADGLVVLASVHRPR